MDELLKTGETVFSMTPELSAIILDYYCLARLKTLSESQANRLAAILEKACDDHLLNFLLNEFDHLLGHELGYLEESDRQVYKNQQALLREYLGTELLSSPSGAVQLLSQRSNP
jgi:succinate dehydrogenase flavin-adding protein (antitoxin of CptAB toxin-antitoxin module)